MHPILIFFIVKMEVFDKDVEVVLIDWKIHLKWSLKLI